MLVITLEMPIISPLNSETLHSSVTRKLVATIRPCDVCHDPNLDQTKYDSASKELAKTEFIATTELIIFIDKHAASELARVNFGTDYERLLTLKRIARSRISFRNPSLKNKPFNCLDLVST
jgi:hypothetical protein